MCEITMAWALSWLAAVTALFTTPVKNPPASRLSFEGPGEYEVADISVIGIAARAHMDEEGTMRATMFKLVAGETSYLVTGHIYPELSEAQLEAIGMVDILVETRSRAT